MHIILIFIVVELSPYSAHTYLNRGNLYASLGQFEEAENDYTHGKIHIFIKLINTVSFIW